jgi:hypothetical protein
MSAEFPIQICYNATGDRDAHPKYIDENKKLVLHQASKCDEQVVFEHN